MDLHGNFTHGNRAIYMGVVAWAQTVVSVLVCLASRLFEMPVNMESIFPSLLLLLSHLHVSHSTSPHRGNCRPIRFEPPMLDFHEQ